MGALISAALVMLPLGLICLGFAGNLQLPNRRARLRLLACYAAALSPLALSTFATDHPRWFAMMSTSVLLLVLGLCRLGHGQAILAQVMQHRWLFGLTCLLNMAAGPFGVDRLFPYATWLYPGQ
jgi:hypothetical protein